jgi:hypothetical protein
VCTLETSMADFDAVLAHIDADLDQALGRLFALLEIKPISTDLAYAAECRECAGWHVEDLRHAYPLGALYRSRRQCCPCRVAAVNGRKATRQACRSKRHRLQSLRLWRSPIGWAS